MNVRLVIERGGQRKVVPIRAAVAVVGRSHGNTVRIPSAEVSRQHCRLTQANGLVLLRDLGSVNGTLLNGQRITQEEVVRPGDRLAVGPVTFLVEYELTPEALGRLSGRNDDLDDLAALADGEVVEVEAVDEDEILDVEAVEETEPLDVLAVVEVEEVPAGKRGGAGKAPAEPIETLSPIGPGGDFDATPWRLPEGGDLRDLLDGMEDEGPPLKPLEPLAPKAKPPKR